MAQATNAATTFVSKKVSVTSLRDKMRGAVLKGCTFLYLGVSPAVSPMQLMELLIRSEQRINKRERQRLGEVKRVRKQKAT